MDDGFGFEFGHTQISGFQRFMWNLLVNMLYNHGGLPIHHPSGEFSFAEKRTLNGSCLETEPPNNYGSFVSCFPTSARQLVQLGTPLSPGSIGAERIYKHKSRGLTWWQGRFYIMKAANPRERSTRAVP